MNDNPLFALSPEQKEDFFSWLREGAVHEVIHLRLREKDLPAATNEQIDEFFTTYACDRWTQRVDRAATEANALITLIRRSPNQFPDAILAALGQEAFRQIVSGKAESADLARYTALFLRARTLEIQEIKLRIANRNATEKALDAFAKELPKNPEALAAFENLKSQLLDQTDHLPDDLSEDHNENLAA